MVCFNSRGTRARLILAQLEEVRKSYNDATDNVYDIWGDSYMRKWLLDVGSRLRPALALR